MKGIFAALLALIMGFTGFATEGGVIEGEEDEFIVQVWLDTDDAVCVLSHANMLDGDLVGGGSACNADMRTPLSGYVYENFRAEDFPEGADLNGFSISFSVSDRFDDGSSTPVAGEIAIPARWGEVYSVIIEGDSAGGYTAYIGE